jgi:hypothetical protein
MEFSLFIFLGGTFPKVGAAQKAAFVITYSSLETYSQLCQEYVIVMHLQLTNKLKRNP